MLPRSRRAQIALALLCLVLPAVALGGRVTVHFLATFDLASAPGEPPPLAAGTGEAPALPDASPAGGALRERVDAYERRLIEEALARAGGSKSAAARDLGVGIRTLYKMLERLGISG